jgi:hypothetical protein
MVRIAIIFLFISLTLTSSGQEISEVKNNSISLQLGKTGTILNLRFDHKLTNKKITYNFSAGSNFAKYLTARSVGAGGSYLFGKRKSFLETGVDISYLIVDEVSDDQGIALVFPNYSIKTFYVSLDIGYRKYTKGGLFRIGVSPGLFKNGFLPGGYVSYGFTF